MDSKFTGACAISKSIFPKRPGRICQKHGQSYVGNGSYWLCRWRKDQNHKEARPGGRNTASRKKRDDKHNPIKNWLKGGIHPDDCTPERFEYFFNKTGGRCSLPSCGKLLSNPFDRTEGLQTANYDHNHLTGRARGILCGWCNGKLVGKLDRIAKQFGKARAIEVAEYYLRGEKNVKRTTRRKKGNGTTTGQEVGRVTGGNLSGEDGPVPEVEADDDRQGVCHGRATPDRGVTSPPSTGGGSTVSGEGDTQEGAGREPNPGRPWWAHG